jgi:cytochrome c oxidase subunit 2
VFAAAGCGGGGAGTTPEAPLVSTGPTTPVGNPAGTSTTETSTGASTTETSTGATTTETSTTGTSTTAGGGGAAVAQGKQVFTGEGGCGSCHTLADAGTSGTVGPDLGKVLAGKDKAFIHESIVKPDADITKGYTAGIMPKDFEQRLGAEKVDALVAYLSSVAGQ